MRRTKINTEYWRKRRQALYDKIPESRLVKNRYRALHALLKERYPEITVDDAVIEFMRDVIYLDREIRRETEGEESELKEILEQEKILELGY